MSNHYTAIGLNISDQPELEAFVLDILKTGHSIDVGDGRYVAWTRDDGPEVTVWVESEQTVTAAHPHFNGDARMRVRIDEWVGDFEQTSLGRRAYAWAEIEFPEGRTFPLIFDLPDGRLFDHVPLPFECYVQIAAFAEELTAYSSEEEYYAQQEHEIKTAADLFVPSGMFTPVRMPEVWVAHAVIAGRVISVQLRENQARGGRFLHALVTTSGGQIDVVADPAIIDGLVQTGGVIYGKFWLSGRVQVDGLRRVPVN